MPYQKIRERITRQTKNAIAPPGKNFSLPSSGDPVIPASPLIGLGFFSSCSELSIRDNFVYVGPKLFPASYVIDDLK